jgi:hypothetical protein
MALISDGLEGDAIVLMLACVFIFILRVCFEGGKEVS